MMSVRVIGRCDHDGCDLWYETPYFYDEVPNIPNLWDVVFDPASTARTLCPWHSRTAKITCEGCKRMDGRCECETVVP